MLTDSVIRATNQLLDDDDDRCQVCRGRLHMQLSPAAMGGVHVRFSCHGSHASFFLDDSLMTQRDVVEALLAFAHTAFQAEARSPDLRELIAYNRGALPC